MKRDWQGVWSFDARPLKIVLEDRTLVRHAAIFLIAVFVLGCAIVAEHQHSLIFEHLRSNSGVDPKIQAGIEYGKGLRKF